MKKLYSLFMMLVVALVVLAGQHTQLPSLKHKPSADTQLLTGDAKLSFVQDFVTKYATKRLSPLASKPSLPSTDAADLQRSDLPKKNAAITLEGGKFLVEPEYEAETKEWYIAVTSNNYTFRLCWFGEEDSYCGTFTFDDISWDYTWGWYESSDLFYEIYPADITMTLSEQKVGNYLQQLILDATIVDTNDKTYVLHIVHDKLTAKSTVETVLDNAQITMGEGQFVMSGSDDAMNIQLAVNSAYVDGYYTEDNLDLNATKIVYNGVEQEIMQANLMVMGGYLDNGVMGYQAELAFFNQDTIQHLVSMIAPLPAAKDTIHVSCTNLVVDETYADYGLIMVSGSSDLYDIFAMYDGYYAEAGVYENVSVSITDMTTWLSCESIFAKLTLQEDNEQGWLANLEVYGADYNYYVIDMKYVVPEPTDTVQIAFEEAASAVYVQESYHMIQLLNYGEDYEASLTIYGVAPGETFTMENVYMDYSGLYDVNASRSVIFADVTGTLSQSGNTTYVNASIIGFNAVQYDIMWWYAVPEPVDTVEIEMPVEFSNAMEYGYYSLSAYAPDSSFYVTLSPMTDEIAGTFINDGMFGKFGTEGGRYDFYAGNTFIYTPADWSNHTVEKGTLVVEMDAQGNIVAEAKIICSNAVYYHITMTTQYNTHLDYDEPDTPVDRTYTTEDMVVIDDQVEDNGYIYLSLTAADMSDMAAFFFFVEETDEDIVIPEGTYPINSSEDYGTVYANPGVQGDGVWPSFYAEMTAEGSLVVPLWLMVDGTVEVTKDDAGNVHMEVNAVNSYNVPIHIVYDGTPTALPEIIAPESDCRKVVIDGQLYIIRDGKAFNAQGAVVK